MKTILTIMLVSVPLAGCGGTSAGPTITAEAENDASHNLAPPERAETDPPAAEQPVVENGEPDINEVYAHCCDLVLKHLKHPATAVVSDRGTVKRMRSEQPGWWVQGTLEAENDLGKRLKREWTISLEWDRDRNAFIPESIDFDGEAVYRSPELQQAMEGAFRAMGNEVSDLPENVAREIRNVQAAVDDVLKAKISLAYSVQWPDDPARTELKVQLKDKFWEVSGKLVRYNAPRRELYGLVEKDSLRVVELRFGSTYLVGVNPDRPPPRQKPARDVESAPTELPKPLPPSAVDAVLIAEETARANERAAKESEAQRHFEIAKGYADKGRKTIAIERLEKLIREWPDTKAAQEAEKQLKKVRGKKDRRR